MSKYFKKNALKTGPRIKGLDGLRGLAALAVFFVHYNQIIDADWQLGPFDLYLFLANGEYGVALFFILSGLLLSQPFWKSILYQRDWPDLKKFFIHRLARILPAYYFVLSLLIIVTDYWCFPEAWTDILLHYSFLFNYTEFSFFSINAPFWTLAVEMQFYCMLPFLFMAVKRLSMLKIIIILVLLSTLSYVLHYGLATSINKTIAWPGSSSLLWIRPYGSVVTHSLLAYLPHFFIGVIFGGILLQLKTVQPHGRVTANGFYELAFWILTSLIVVLLSTELGELIQIPFGHYGLPLVPILFGLIILSSQYALSAHVLLNSLPLRFMGMISYGIYIYHLPILGFVDHYMMAIALDAREHWIILGSIALALSIFAATISYYLIERPVLNRVHRNTPKE
ncbi:MAG: acyltransferase [gamma proteobacterium symbiont of Bathyaustriella thionipta]|nr:acyltransferase [gamma proteobacterium symbiont of Bathyaustriella thionipta]MCU7950007.1 acyltransferase [gamma proteobacterium symbiont of Bathyaustriella thionipta]MCU7953806.1 acyltransferase [gamma proteobacterium symbiont of Bathyaustriella thionipta]MCU7956603.1 acyltransferase [gamma proteobacterium symbiont of Bathyaustriella thionipta]MCU7968605.1 acyltransferase [gamma proteobacterium symbiont of Bathyaustriella thionipta]